MNRNKQMKLKKENQPTRQPSQTDLHRAGKKVFVVKPDNPGTYE